MGFNHVSLNPLSVNDPDENIQLSSINLFNVGIGTIVPAVAGKRVSVHWLFLSMFNAAASSFNFLELTPAGATISIQTGGLQGAGNGTPYIFPYQQFPWFTCAAGNALAITSGGTINIAGRVMYVQG